MKFQEAKEKLKGIAAGRYHSVEYKLTQYSEDTGGEMYPECTVYIDGMEHYKGNTWEKAFTALDRKMNGAEVKEDEMPGDEIAATVEWGTQ